MLQLPDYSIAYILWVGALALAAVAAFQMLYFLILLIPGRRPRALRQPNAPLMPTNPANLDARQAASAPIMSGSRMGVLSGLDSTEEIPLPNNNFLIGRYYHPENNIHIALDEKSISRRHAQFQGDDRSREYYITDTNSSYGTFLRTADKVQQFTPNTRFRVYTGDIIQFGQQVSVRMFLPGDSRPSADNADRNTR